MKNSKSRILAYIMVFMMIFTMIPAMPASAAAKNLEYSIQGNNGEFTITMNGETWTTGGCGGEDAVEGSSLKNMGVSKITTPEHPDGKTFQGWAVYERTSYGWKKISGSTYLTTTEMLNYTIPADGVMYMTKWKGQMLEEMIVVNRGLDIGIQGNGGEFTVTMGGETWTTTGCGRGDAEPGASLKDLGYTKVTTPVHPNGKTFKGWYPYKETDGDWTKIPGANLLTTTEMLNYEIPEYSVLFYAQWGDGTGGAVEDESGEQDKDDGSDDSNIKEPEIDPEVPLHSIIFDKTSSVIECGEQIKLIVSKIPTDTTDENDIIWTSSNPVVAEVSADGTVTAVSEGEAVITATVNGISAECAVTVQVPAESADPNRRVLMETVKEIINSSDDDYSEVSVTEKTEGVLKEAINNGAEITIQPSTNKITREEASKMVYDEKYFDTQIDYIESRYKVAGYYDIKMILQANGAELGTVDRLSDEYVITIKLPYDLPALAAGYERVFYIYRIHNYSRTALAASLVENGTAIEFSTDEFSPYILAFEDVLEGSKGIAINETNFPDPVFRAYVRKWKDDYSDGYITEDDNGTGTTNVVDVQGLGIKDLTGIEYLNGIDYLYCENNQITHLDISKMNTLEYVHAAGNKITSVKLSPFVDYDTLDLRYNKMKDDSAINKQGNTSVDDMYLYYFYPQGAAPKVKIDEINFPDSTFRSIVKSIDKYGNGNGYFEPAIEDGNNEIGSNFMEIQNRGITSLKGIEYFTRLQSLDCSGNQLTSLDVSALCNLRNLECRNNNITSLKLCREANYSTLDLLYNELKDINSIKSQVSEENQNGIAYYPQGEPVDVIINEANFPDAKFRAVLRNSDYDRNSDGVLSAAELERLKYLSAYQKGITDLQGIGYLTSLYSLDCGSNYLEEIPALPESLKELYCSNNYLTELPQLPEGLTYLSCYNNCLVKLPSLPDTLIQIECAKNDLTKLPSIPAELKYISCSENQLTALPSLSEGLTALICAKNKLTKLPTLPESLTRLECSGNSLTALPSLPAALKELRCSDNKLAKLPSISKYMETLDANNNQIAGTVDLSGAHFMKNVYLSNNKITCVKLSSKAKYQYIYVTKNHMTDTDDMTGRTDIKWDGTAFKFYDQKSTCEIKGHSYGAYKVTDKAEFGAKGTKTATCTKCKKKKTASFNALKSPTLSVTVYTFNDKVKTPSVKLTDAGGKKISSSNYEVTYDKGRKNVGTYKVTIKMKGTYYSGKKTLYFKINPASPSSVKLTKGKKQFKVSWKKPSKTYRNQIDGYQIRYATSKSGLAKATPKKYSGNTITSKTIKNLKSQKYYYVQVRTYNMVGNTPYYSGWTSYKTVKTK